MQEQIARARMLADDGDMYEMDECPETYATCRQAACIHVILMAAAA